MQAKKGKGQAAPGARHRLNDDERQRLADRLPLIDSRTDLGLSREAAEKAAAGAILPNEAVERIARFLAR
jgi:hypothetical protein